MQFSCQYQVQTTKMLHKRVNCSKRKEKITRFTCQVCSLICVLQPLFCLSESCPPLIHLHLKRLAGAGTFKLTKLQTTGSVKDQRASSSRSGRIEPLLKEREVRYQKSGRHPLDCDSELIAESASRTTITVLHLFSLSKAIGRQRHIHSRLGSLWISMTPRLMWGLKPAC
jgi:hypothetical protein